MNMKDFENQIAKIEQNFVSYSEMANITSCNIYTDKERFVALPNATEGHFVVAKYQENFKEMQEFTPQALVRKSVLDKLQNVGLLINKINPDWQLVVTEGWRTLEVQTMKFNAVYEKVKDIELAHQIIAAPDVAGHPSGGAVDVTIFDTKNNKAIDFGSEIYDFTDKICYVKNPKIEVGSEAWFNRMLLRGAMMSQGFAPFDGEWWHFSYGDQEWAAYYGKTRAVYGQLL